MAKRNAPFVRQSGPANPVKAAVDAFGPPKDAGGQSAKPTGGPNPPFATKDGKPQNQGRTSGGGADFLKDNGLGSADRTPPPDPMVSRPQQPAPASMPAPDGPLERAARPQMPRPVHVRLGGDGEQYRPADGVTHGVPVDAVPAYRRETAGSVGATHVPFRNLK